MSELVKIGIKQETIDKLLAAYGETPVDLLEINMENTYKIYNFLVMLGIKDIDNILLSRIDLFSMDYNEFISKIENRNMNDLRDLINRDPSSIEKIFFNVDE